MSLSGPPRRGPPRHAAPTSTTEAPRSGDARGRHPARAPPRPVDPFAELKRTVHQTLLESLGPQLYDARLTQSELEQKVRLTLQEVLRPGRHAADRQPTGPGSPRRSPTTSSATARIEPYLRDPDVTEVMVNGPDSIYVERGGQLFQVDGSFTDEAHLRRTIDKIVGRVGRRVDESSPMVDARLPDGSRVNAIIPPLARRRLAADDPEVLRPTRYTADDLVAFGTLTRAGRRLPRARASAAASTSSSPAAPAPARRRRSTCCPSLHPGGRARRHHRGRGGAPAAPGARRCGSRPARRTSRARAR